MIKFTYSVIHKGEKLSQTAFATSLLLAYELVNYWNGPNSDYKYHIVETVSESPSIGQHYHTSLRDIATMKG